jgi:hypothetical protein
VEQLQAGGPTLGPPSQFGEVLGWERFSVEVPEQLLDLPGPETEVVGADLTQLPGDAESGQVEGGRVPRRHEQVDGRGEIFEEPLELEFRRSPEQGVEVVDDEKAPGAGPGVQGRDEVFET